MKHVSFFICLVFWVCAAIAQNPDIPLDKKKIENTKPPISLYKVISHQRDTTYVDTTLSIQKSYKFNYLRSDTFELLPFSNVGQTYNALAINTQSKRLIPLFAAQSHHYNYKEIEDVSYFNVPTPLTEIYFKTAFEQGQQLQAFFTINTSKQFNFSMSYQGVRSLGTYQQSLTSTGNLLITSNYFSKNDRYNVRFHLASHDILNRENGGLTQNSLDLFINDDPEFSDRGRLDVNFEDAENNLKGVRLYLNQEYALTQKADSIHTTSLTLGNSIWYEDKLFEYRQQNAYEQYGASYEATDLYTKTTLEEFNLQGYVKFTNRLLGNFKVFTTLTDYNYGYNTVLNLNSGQIPNRIKDKVVSLGATYQKQYKGFDINAAAAINVGGATTGNYINATAGFNLNEDTRAQGSIKIHNAAPNFNFQLYQSDYVNYNWKTEFNTIKTQELGFDLWSKKIANLSFTYTGIDDYTYFSINTTNAQEGSFLRPSP
ncbi:MAG: putative porin, partial [Patiriisocius sp.]